MTDLETRLDEALKADAAPVRDPMFRIVVLEQRERAALRRRLVAASGLAVGATILAAVGLAATEALPNGVERLSALSVLGVALAAAMVAPYLGGATALRRLAAEAAWALRAAARLWP